jgi:hypothetical protein
MEERECVSGSYRRPGRRWTETEHQGVDARSFEACDKPRQADGDGRKDGICLDLDAQRLIIFLFLTCLVL